MKRKRNKRNGAEFPFLLYFPRELREVSKRDRKFHGLLMSDAYAPRSREAALSWLEVGKDQLVKTRAWDRGIRYSYYQRKYFLRDPESQYCVDFEAFIKEFLRYVEQEDCDAFLEVALAFFDKYPIFEGAYGWVPWMARGITITPVALACWNCTTVTRSSAENFGQEPHCCDKPQIEPFYDVTHHYIGASGFTGRRMGELEEPVEKRLRARFEGCWDPESFAKITGARLRYGEKTGRRQRILERQKELQQIRDHARDYKEEIRRARRDPTYESPVIKRLRKGLRKKHLGFDLPMQALTEELIWEDLDEYARKYPKERVPKPESLLKRRKRKQN